ncbi:MAG: ABC transporter permease [Planctomycetes bacterium]|nr:ABC transporter permease [Planctomycetota bacterium]
MTVLPRDTIELALSAVRAQRQRSGLTALGIAVGIAAVVLLLAIGTGLQRFVLAEFTQFGTNLLQVTPGRTQTFGVSGAMLNSVRPLSLADAEAFERLPGVRGVVPMVMGNAAVEHGGRTRRTSAYGVSAAMPQVWRFAVASGTFLPDDDPATARAFVVLGATVQRELFGARPALGAVVRIGGERYRVQGVMQPKGQFLGIDLDDAVYLPAARALALYDRDGLMEIDVAFGDEASSATVTAAVRRTLLLRHGGEDFTITAQQQMLDVLGSVLSVLTLGIAGLGGISLLVGGVGILTILTIAIGERTGEIGLLRALGATRREVLRLFLGEAAALAALGGALGLLLGVGCGWLLRLLVPALPVATTLPHVLLAEGVAILVGLVAGTAPALRAARLDPIEALRAE